MLRALLATLLKIVPLSIYVRSVACKLGFPILMCDGPLCPAAIGQPAQDGCTPNGNTAECKAWCEHGWTPWLNGILSTAGIPLSVTCDEASDFILLKALAVVIIIGYTLLWSSPRLGALWLTVFMGFGLHFHVTAMKDTLEKMAMQITLFSSSLLVLILECMAPTASSPKPKKE